VQNTFQLSAYRQFRNKEDTRVIFKPKFNSPDIKRYCPEVTISYEPPFIHLKAKGCEFEKTYTSSPDILDLNNMFIAFKTITPASEMSQEMLAA
jgi:hypothetical protein